MKKATNPPFVKGKKKNPPTYTPRTQTGSPIVVVETVGKLESQFSSDAGKPSLLQHTSKSSIELTTSMEEPNNSDPGSESKPETIYRCKKCRRIVASHEHIVTHEPGEGQKCFKWRKRSSDLNESAKEAHECSSIFVEPLKWMESVQEGCVGDKLQCIGCKARLGNFNWAGMQCNCGAWVNPAFQLHKSKMDECKL